MVATRWMDRGKWRSGRSEYEFGISIQMGRVRLYNKFMTDSLHNNAMD